MRLLVLAALCLSGCTNIVPSTVMRLAAISPIEANPADVAVAITLPEGLEIVADSARLVFTMQKSDVGEVREGVFVLERVPAQRAIFRVAPDDLGAMRDLQATARQWKSEDDDTFKGSLSVTLAPCRIGDGPADDARASLAIRLSEDGVYLPLIRDGPVSAVVEAEQLLEMGPCGTVR